MRRHAARPGRIGGVTRLRHAWPFFLLAILFLAFAAVLDHLWPNNDPCAAASVMSNYAGACKTTRTTIGTIVPLATIAFGLAVGALGLIKPG